MYMDMDMYMYMYTYTCTVIKEPLTPSPTPAARLLPTHGFSLKIVSEFLHSFCGAIQT